MASGTTSSYKWLVFLLLVIFIATAAFLFYAIFAAANWPGNTIGKASSMIAMRWGLSIYLVKGLVILASIPYFYAWSKILPDTKAVIMKFATPSLDPLQLFRQKWGYGWFIVAYGGFYYIILAIASQNAYASKNCADTPEGVYATDNTGADPKYGQPLKPCSLAQIEELTHPAPPKELSATEVKQRGFFNISGYPQIWYSTGDDGAYRFFDRRGHNRDGDELKPVTRDVVAGWYRQQKRLLSQKQSAEQKRQSDEAQAVAQQSLAANAAQAQQQYQSGAFEQALVSCKPVLAANAADEDCKEIQHDASAKLAAQLTGKAQAELQHGELVDAERNANRAARLDPTNESAKTVLVLAQQLRASR